MIFEDGNLMEAVRKEASVSDPPVCVTKRQGWMSICEVLCGIGFKPRGKTLNEVSLHFQEEQ